MEYIIDFQAFKKPINDYVIKELAILDVNKGVTELYVFKPPFEWDLLPVKYKVENKWLETHYIDRKWSSGFVKYEELKNILKRLSDAKRIFVKGDQKCKWLKRYMNNVCNLEGNNTLALKELRKLSIFKCENHLNKKNDVNCAECNVRAIHIWCIFYLETYK